MRQCRERYRNYLASETTSGEWKAEDDALLLQKVEEFGQKWSQISGLFQGRTELSVKNRWNTIKGRVTDRIEEMDEGKASEEEAEGSSDNEKVVVAEPVEPVEPPPAPVPKETHVDKPNWALEVNVTRGVAKDQIALFPGFGGRVW